MASPNTWQELWIKWTDRLIWLILLALLSFMAHHTYYDYLVDGLLKAGKDKKQIEELLK